MPKQIKIFITTDDTGKTYEMPGYDGDNPKDQPRLWLVELRIKLLDKNGQGFFKGLLHEFYVEQSTIEKLGMIPYHDTPEPQPPITKKDEVRETLEKLLSLLGVYPEHREIL